MSSSAAVGEAGSEPAPIRPPRQRRSQEAWRRVLDAGVALLEEGGYEAFTIAAVCDRAQVAPRALYARAESKDALFLAVYEHGMSALAADRAVFADDERWRDLSADQLADAAVGEVAALFGRHAALLRAVVLLSGVHPEVYRRGAGHSQALGEAFTGRLLHVRDHIDHPDPESAIRSAFTMIFAVLVLRVAYGPGFAAPATTDEEFVQTMTTMVRRYLFG